MINHISLAVHEPLHAAEVVAELWQGRVMPFPEHPGSYIALALDPYGTMIEFWPKNTVLKPGLDHQPIQFADSNSSGQEATVYTATHANITVPISESQIYAIAERVGWRAVHCKRGGFFELIEFWIENEVLLELLPPTLVERYLVTMHPENLKLLVG